MACPALSLLRLTTRISKIYELPSKKKKEKGYIYFVFAEIKGVDTDNKTPKTGNDTFSKTNGEGLRNTSESIIN